ncbi:hypothetical protein BH11ACT3_BH11ACT3_13070 [soil metagenome]
MVESRSHKRRTTGIMVGLVAVAALTLGPALSASADILDGPYSSLAACNSVRSAYLHNPDVRVTDKCGQLFPGKWYFQYVYV